MGLRSAKVSTVLASYSLAISYVTHTKTSYYTQPGISETRFGSSRPILKRSESQWRDRDWKCLSLKDKTGTETEKVWVSVTRPRPRLKRSESHSRDRDHKNFETKTKVVKTVKDETRKFGSRLISENLLRPRLIETGKFYRCWDRDSSRLGNSTDIETETYRDLEIS